MRDIFPLGSEPRENICCPEAINQMAAELIVRKKPTEEEEEDAK